MDRKGLASGGRLNYNGGIAAYGLRPQHEECLHITQESYNILVV